MIVKPVREALEYYRRLNEQCREERIHRKSIVDLGDLPPAHLAQAAAAAHDPQAMVKSGSGHSVKSRKSFQVGIMVLWINNKKHVGFKHQM